LAQPIEIQRFPDRHFWHAGYGKALLENYAFDLQEANDRLKQQLREARDQIKMLKGML
jgi:hypothetical protein